MYATGVIDSVSFSERTIGRGALLRAGFEPRRVNRLRWLRKAQLLKTYDVEWSEHLGYLLAGPEIDNFTYELLNEHELVVWLADMLTVDSGRVAEFILEARSSEPIYETLRAATKGRWSMKTAPPIGRRLGWYAVVRLLRPRRIIETGIHDGIGSLALLAALDRNAEEGHDGELVSFDVDRSAGWIVRSHPRWSRRIEDTRVGLASALAETPTSVFIHDSLHTLEHERFELELAAAHMNGGALISDNSHVSTVLRDVCLEAGRRYSLWRERPRDHFYPGAGIGLGV